MPVLHLLPKMGFRPAGVTRCPDEREIWHGGADFTFIGAEMREFSPQDCQNLKFFAQLWPSGATRLHNFYEILSVCTRP